MNVGHRTAILTFPSLVVFDLVLPFSLSCIDVIYVFSSSLIGFSAGRNHKDNVVQPLLTLWREKLGVRGKRMTYPKPYRFQ